MEQPITITSLNDFIFCPASIYFHKQYESLKTIVYQSEFQINGKHAHESVDNQAYSSRSNILQGIDVYCEKYNLTGKIDLFFADTGELVERKKLIKNIYDGYVFQIYAQYFAMIEMGYSVKKLCLHSLDDNRKYPIKFPEEDKVMFDKFESIIKSMASFDILRFVQTNESKCQNCIYEPFCDRTLK